MAPEVDCGRQSGRRSSSLLEVGSGKLPLQFSSSGAAPQLFRSLITSILVRAYVEMQAHVLLLLT